MRPPLGSGARFKALTAQLANKPKPAAKKYGQAKMTAGKK